MATYRVTSPDGTKYRVTGPDGASNEEVLSQIEAYRAPKTPKTSPKVTPPAYEPSLMDGVSTNAKGAVSALADYALGAPGFFAGLATMPAVTALEQDPTAGLEVGKDVMSRSMPSSLAGVDLEGNKAYEYLMKPMELLSEGINYGGEKIGQTAGMLGASPETQKGIASTAEMAALGLMGYKGGKKALSVVPEVVKAARERMTPPKPAPIATPPKVSTTGQIPTLDEHLSQGGNVESYDYMKQFLGNGRQGELDLGPGGLGSKEGPTFRNGELPIDENGMPYNPELSLDVQTAARGNRDLFSNENVTGEASRVQKAQDVEAAWAEREAQQKTALAAEEAFRKSQEEHAAREDAILSQVKSKSSARSRVSSTSGRHPLGGVGRKQGGAIGFENNDSLVSSSAGASSEAISRKASDTASGIGYFRYNPHTDEIIPITDVTRADYRAPAGTSILKVGADGTKTIVENNSSFGKEGLINRFSSKHPLGGVGKKQGGAIDPTVFEGLFPEFAKSSLRDALGKLKVFYHGTSKDTPFKQFKESPRGTYLTDDPKTASQYAIENDSMKIEYRPSTGFEHKNTASRVMPVYVNAERVYRLTPEDANSYKYATNYAKAQKELTERVKAQGYQAIEYSPGVIAVLDPKNIESAISPSRMSPKQRGGPENNWEPAKTREQIKKALSFGSTKKEVEVPDILTSINRPSTLYKDTSVEGLKSELLKDGKRTLDDISSWERATNWLTPGAMRSHPLQKFVYGKILKTQEKQTELYETWAHDPEWQGFNRFRNIPKVAHKESGALTELKRLMQTRPDDIDHMWQVLDKRKGLEESTLSNLMDEGLTPETAKVALTIRKVLSQKVLPALKEAGLNINDLPGFIPANWSGSYRTFVRDKVTNKLVGVYAHNNKYLGKPKLDPDLYSMSTSKVDMSNPLSEIEMQTVLKAIQNDKLHDAVKAEMEKFFSEQGIRAHALKADGVTGYLGSVEKTAKARNDGRLQSMEMYLRSAAKHAAKAAQEKEMISLLNDKELNRQYGNGIKQAGLDWNIYKGEMNEVGKFIDNVILDNATELLTGYSVKEAREVARTLSRTATYMKIMVGNVANLLVNKMQPFFDMGPQLATQGNKIVFPMIQGTMDYFTIRHHPELMDFARDMDRKGVISTMMTRELEDPTKFGKDHAKGVHDLIEEGLLKRETDRTELTSRLLASLISRRAHQAKGYSGEVLNNLVQNDVNTAMGDYNTHGKAPAFSSSGTAGTLFGTASTYAVNQVARTLSYAANSVKGSNKYNNAKALVLQTVLWGTVGSGLTGLAYVKWADEVINRWNGWFPDDPIIPLSERIFTSDSLPDVLKLGALSHFSGVNLQNTMSQPTSMGGISASPLFALEYGKNLADSMYSTGSDLLSSGSISDASARKLERIAPPVVAGMIDSKRTGDNNLVSTDKEGKGVYQRSYGENQLRNLGLTSTNEGKYKTTERVFSLKEKRANAAANKLKDKIIKYYDSTGVINEEWMDQYQALGKNTDVIYDEIDKNKEDKVTTSKERREEQGLTDTQEIIYKEMGL